VNGRELVYGESPKSKVCRHLKAEREFSEMKAGEQINWEWTDMEMARTVFPYDHHGLVTLLLV
jgi:hypothetical protein